MNNHNNSNLNNSPQQWMMQTDQGPEPYNYMVSRPSGSVLPPPQHQNLSIQQQHHLQQQQQQQQQLQRQQSLKHELSVSPPPAQALDYDNSKFPKGSRAVIPSKRAAQNRAAQKAFRQRREQYIKDLEIKAKDLEDWQEEMDKLRKENGELRERVASLENQVAILTGGDTSKIAELNKSVSTIPTSSPITTSEVIEPIKSPQRSMSLPTASPPPPSSSSSSSSTPVLESIRPSSASPSIITSSSAVKRSHNESRLRHEHNNESDPITEEEGSFVPVPLRAPNPTGFETTPSYHPNDHTATLIGNESIKRRKLNNIGLPNTVQEPINNSITVNTHHPKALPIQQLPQQSLPPPQQLQYPPEFWNTSNTMPDMAAATASASGMGDLDLDFNFDPFFEDEFGPTLTNTNDFLPNANSGQVLDDLFAMLQTRQRPQIPMVPAEDNNESNIVNESLGKLG